MATLKNSTPTLQDSGALNTDFLPVWIDQSGLSLYRSADYAWVVTKGTFAENANNNVTWKCGQSTATLVDTVATDTASKKIYATSINFSLIGEDKTSLKWSTKFSSGTGSKTAAYSTGASTTTTTDDLTFSASESSSAKAYSSSMSVKQGNGLAVTSSISATFSGGIGATGYSPLTDSSNYGAGGTYKATGKFSLSDANSNKFSATINMSGTTSGEEVTATAITLGAGSFSVHGSAVPLHANDSTSLVTITWSTVSVLDMDFFNIFKNLTDKNDTISFDTLISGVENYILDSANTMTFKTLSGTSNGAHAEAGNDTITGGDGNEDLSGDSGNDSLSGGPGTDTLDGGTGNDILNGGTGNDVIIGGVGTDKLAGGTGMDTFVFAAGDSGQTASTLDVISDFAKGAVNVGDLIDYSDSLTLGGSNATATDTQALINQTTGIATFAKGSGVTLADALSDITTRFTASTDSAGELAFFKVNNAGNYYAFISDGTAGVTANDILIQLSGITSIKNIDLTDGNLTILS